MLWCLQQRENFTTSLFDSWESPVIAVAVTDSYYEVKAIIATAAVDVPKSSDTPLPVEYNKVLAIHICT